MTLFSIKHNETGLYLCNGAWGEEPEWFEACELKALERQYGTVAHTEENDFRACDWE